MAAQFEALAQTNQEQERGFHLRNQLALPNLVESPRKSNFMGLAYPLLEKVLKNKIPKTTRTQWAEKVNMTGKNT